MGIGARDLRQYVIGPTLQRLGLWSLAAENVLLDTAAQESKFGHYLHQVEGSILWLYQIELASTLICFVQKISEGFAVYQPKNFSSALTKAYALISAAR